MQDVQTRRLVIGVGTISGALALVGETWLPFAVAGVVMVALAALALLAPGPFLYFVMITSAGTALLREVGSIGGVSVSGVRWIGVAAIAAIVVGLNWQHVPKPRHVWLFFAFAFWSAYRWVLQGGGIVGLKDVVFYLLPILIALYALFVLVTYGEAERRRLAAILVFSAFIPGVMYAILLPTPLIDITEMGPRGVMNPRATAVYLVTVLTATVSANRYGVTKRERIVAGWTSAALSLIVIATLSRAATLLALGVLALSRVQAARVRKLLLGGVVAAVAMIVLIWVTPPLQSRFFHRPPTSVRTALQYLDMKGREVMWPATLLGGLRQPLIGNGPGTARLMLAKVSVRADGRDEVHPHNEYLQVFHDLGVIGLVLLLAAWFVLTRYHWRAWADASARGAMEAAKWNMAAVLAIGVVLANSLVDNTLHYTPVMSVAFVISALGWFSAEDRRA